MLRQCRAGVPLPVSEIECIQRQTADGVPVVEAFRYVQGVVYPGKLKCCAFVTAEELLAFETLNSRIGFDHHA